MADQLDNDRHAITPSLAAFSTAYEQGAPQLLSCRIVGDLETPISAYLKLCADKANSFLLESVEGGVTRGRYSVIGLDPDIIWRANRDKAEILRDASNPDYSFQPETLDTMKSLRALLAESRIPIPADLPPMAAGVFGFMSYDTVRLVEELPNINPDDLNLPESILVRPSLIVVFDSVKDEIIFIAPVRARKELSAKQAYEKGSQQIIQAIVDLNGPLPARDTVQIEALEDFNLDEPQSNMTADAYKSIVTKAKEHIAAGDIFQIVLSQRFSAPFPLSPFALYRALRRTNPSPYLYYLNFGDFSIAGSSPEILVRAHEKKVTIRPIAGTRKRGATAQEDKALSQELLNDPKECAEHLMLLDLGRNDVGRVSTPGSVSVVDQFFLEYYSHVMHIVSHVEGDLLDELDEIDALMGGFPAGTVSGAPKVRAMELIDQFEVAKRGVYAGCVGYFTSDGNMDSCIVLRTAIVKDGIMYVQAGAGIVADSDPQSEQEECVNKAKALFNARHVALLLERQQRGEN